MKHLIWVHAALDDAGLTAYAFRAYARIARRAGPKGTCFESIPHMADGCGMSERQMHYALRELMERNLVKKITRPGRSSHYSLTNPDVWGEPEPLHQVQGTPASGAAVSNTREGKNTEAKASVSAPEPKQEKPREAKPKKGPSKHGILIGNAIEIWNEHKHPAWPELRRMTSRGAKYLKEFLAHFDGDPERATEELSAAVRYAVKHEDWWRDRGSIGFDELAARNKLEGYADKARSRGPEQGEKREEGAEGGNTPQDPLLGRRVRSTYGWLAILKHKELNRYWAEYQPDPEQSQLAPPEPGWLYDYEIAEVLD